MLKKHDEKALEQIMSRYTNPSEVETITIDDCTFIPLE